MAEWQTFTWNGEPLSTMVGEVVDELADIVQLMADILQATADILYVVADLVDIAEALITDPMAAITEALILILETFLDLMGGNHYVLVIYPQSAADLTGPEDFVDTVVDSFGDTQDSMRPQFGSGESVCGLAFYWNMGTMTELASATAGLAIMFPGLVALIEAIAEAVENYEPYDPELGPASFPERTEGRWPDWRNGTLFAMFAIMSELYGPLNQLRSSIEPRGLQGDFIRLLADSTLAVATLLEDIAQQLEDIATLLNGSLFTAARLKIPLDTGGNNYLIESLNDSVDSLIASGSYSDDYYSVGVVIVTDEIGCPILDILGGP
jgi:hypothetical protein